MKTVVTAVLILCVFALAASLTGAGMMAIVSVLSSFFIFIFLPLFPRRSPALAVRRVHHGRLTRAPPPF